MPTPVRYGGTGATTASGARTALGLAIGSDVQAYAAALAAVAGGTWAGATSITTLGTIGAGAWQGTAVGVAYGGTGATTAAGARANLGVDAALPSGAVVMHAGASAPSGWVLCDGSTYDGTDSTYTALWNAVGTTFGGTGQSSFKVPDLRGRAPIGVGTGTGLTARARGDQVGAETHTLTTTEMPAHTHGLAWSGVYVNNGSAVAVPDGGTDAQTGSAGSDGAHNNMQPSLALNFIIKL